MSLRLSVLPVVLGLAGCLPILPGEAVADQLQGNASAAVAWPTWIVAGLIVVFVVGFIQSLRTYVFTRRTLRREIDRPKPTLAEVQVLADAADRPLPFIVILLPARNEAAVIHNTLSRLAQLNYPRDRYAVAVLTDVRERKNHAALYTSGIAARIAKQLNSRPTEPFIYVVEVPAWYSGRFGDPSQTYAPSTKGRALNYGLEYIRRDPRLARADMLGVLDADGRLHADVLLEVASQVLARGEQLLQGPVFQISNLSAVGLAGKAAGIELSVYHLSTLSRQLLSGRDTARFLAGTNYFVTLPLMLDVGGWDDTALVEDAELGLRLYLRKRVRPAWLSCHEVEQTPPDCRSYLVQRQRWALGHFQLLPLIRRSGLPWHAKLVLRAKLLHAIFMCPLDVGLPILSWTALVLGWAAVMPASVGWIMIGLLVGSVFVWDYFGRGLRLLNRYAPEPWPQRRLWLYSAGFILAMPWLMVLQAVPRIVAFGKYISGSPTREWQKTPRTEEVPWVFPRALTDLANPEATGPAVEQEAGNDGDCPDA